MKAGMKVLGRSLNTSNFQRQQLINASATAIPVRAKVSAQWINEGGRSLARSSTVAR